MLQAEVGGDPDVIGTGADALGRAATGVGAISGGIKSQANAASDASGQPQVGASLARFAAAWSEQVAAISIQLKAGATLGRHAAADLAVAGGDRPR